MRYGAGLAADRLLKEGVRISPEANRQPPTANRQPTQPQPTPNRQPPPHKRYIAKAGTADGAEAGTSEAGGPFARLSAFLRGRKASADRIEVRGIDDGLLNAAAAAMDGFSAREIAKFAASVQAAVYGSPEPVLNRELFARVLEYKLKEHAARKAFVLGHHGAGETATGFTTGASAGAAGGAK
jgi:hypothetical protein